MNLDKEIYNKAGKKSHELIFQKKQYCKIKLRENIVKPKDFWKTLKSLGLSKNFSVVQTNAIEDNKHLQYDLKTVDQTFWKVYPNLTESWIFQIPPTNSI